MALTQEQLEALMSMNDITGMEDEQTRMIKLAEGLRNSSKIQGSDVGANIGRAAYGVGGAIADYKARKKAPEISTARQDMMTKLLRSMKKPMPNVPTLPVPAAPVMEEDVPYVDD